jgi:hypothetical protein
MKLECQISFKTFRSLENETNWWADREIRCASYVLVVPFMNRRHAYALFIMYAQLNMCLEVGVQSHGNLYCVCAAQSNSGACFLFSNFGFPLSLTPSVLHTVSSVIPSTCNRTISSHIRLDALSAHCRSKGFQETE